MSRNYFGSNESGLKAEDVFRAMLNEKGIMFDYDDQSYYDFRVNGHKVEVKSASISVSTGKSFGVGRFDFTDEDSRQQQFDENVWVCFIVHIRKDNYQILGFQRAKQLEMKRYISIGQWRKYKPLTVEDWIKQVNK